MPMYDYECQNEECNHKYEEMHVIADRDKPESEPCSKCGKNTIKRIFKAPAIGDAVRLGIRKPSGAFKEVLHNIHNKTYGSDLNTTKHF